MNYYNMMVNSHLYNHRCYYVYFLFAKIRLHSISNSHTLIQQYINCFERTRILIYRLYKNNNNTVNDISACNLLTRRNKPFDFCFLKMVLQLLQTRKILYNTSFTCRLQYIVLDLITICHHLSYSYKQRQSLTTQLKSQSKVKILIFKLFI